MYEQVPGTPLSQGDIIDDCPISTLEVASLRDIPTAAGSLWRVRAVVLTQACDLAQVRTDRVLVASVHAAADLVANGLLKPNVIRDQIRRGQVFGWYFLPAAPAAIALPESIV